MGAELMEKSTRSELWTRKLGEWTKSKQNLRELPVQKNLADTSQNGKIPMNGQLKAKPEIQKNIRTWCPGLERS